MANPARRSAVLALLPVLLLPLAARSAEPTSVVPTDPRTQPLPDAPASGIDLWHDRFVRKVQEFIERTDARFARDQSNLLPVPESPFRIGLESDFVHRQDGSIEIDPRLNVDVLLHLPNIQRRLRLFITSDSVDEMPSRPAGATSGVRAGLRVTPLSNFDFDVGIRIDVPPIAFTSLRWQRSVPLGIWQMQPFAKLYLETGEGLGMASGITFDRRVSDLIFRSTSYGNWRKDRQDTEWTQTLILAHAKEIIRFGRYTDMLDGRDLARGYGLQVVATGTRDIGVESYEAALLFNHRTPIPWLYWHAMPLLRWERQFGWHPDPGIRIGIDALFRHEN